VYVYGHRAKQTDAVLPCICSTNDLLPPGPNDGIVCKREAIDCFNKSTLGLKYLSLLGNKLGPQPLPEKISKHVFLELLQHAQSASDLELVRNWYRPDSLSFPVQFTLLSPLYAAEEMQKGADLDDLSPEDKLQAAQRYVAVDKGLRKIVKAALSHHHPELVPKSLLEGELDIFLGGPNSSNLNPTPGKAIAASPGASSPGKRRASAGASQASRSMMVARTIRGIDCSHTKAKAYLDLTPEGLADVESGHLIDWLHQTGVQQYLGSGKNVFRGLVNWQSSGLSVHHPQFEPYFLAVEEKVTAMIRESLDIDLKIRTAKQLHLGSSGVDEGPVELVPEVRAHAQHAQQLMSKFVLPEVDTIVANLSRAPTGGQSQPLFLLGGSGSGKSHIIAAVSQRLSEQDLPQQSDGPMSSVYPTLSRTASKALNSPKCPSIQLEHGADDASNLLAVFDASAHTHSNASPISAVPSVDVEASTRPRVVITRFCNISARSRNARGILGSIATQLKVQISCVALAEREQCVAVCCSVLPCVAECCNVPQGSDILSRACGERECVRETLQIASCIYSKIQVRDCVSA